MVNTIISKYKSRRIHTLFLCPAQVVQLSRHKFASNVVEKCLAYCDSDDRDALIREMLGPDEANEPLLAMMTDQFANYVVQKLLEICDERQQVPANAFRH